MPTSQKGKNKNGRQRRKICFITERRADYSRFKPIMKAVQKSNKLELQLIVTGMHLLKHYGETKRVVKNDGFKIDAVLPMFRKNDTDDGASMSRALGRALIGFSDLFKKMKPDIIFAGFDIGANFAAAIAGMHQNIHVAHIQGGEVSGTIDEIIRHGITKFAHIHFPPTKKSAERIIRMGENPKYVFNVGSPNVDTIRNTSYKSRGDIFKKYNLNPKKKLVIFSQHPVTTEVDDVIRQITTSIGAIKDIAKKYGTETLVIYSNNDAGGQRIVKELKKLNMRVVPHIVFEDYINLLKEAAVLVGNSSTGIHEAPSFGLPAVNIGTRQQFRERGKNVIDVPHNRDKIFKAVEKALLDKAFLKKVRASKNPYDSGKNVAQTIVRILETIKLPPIQKVMTY